MFEFTVQKLNALYSYIFPCKGEHMVEEGLTDGGDGGDDLAELELVEDGGLTGGIKPDHEDPHLLLGEEAAEQLPEREPHLFLCHNTRPNRFQPTAHRSTSTDTRFDSNARKQAHPTEIPRNGSQVTRSKARRGIESDSRKKKAETREGTYIRQR